MKKQYSIIPLAVVAIFCINPLQAEEFRMIQKASAASEFSKIFIEKALTAASFQISSSELALEKTKNFKNND